MRNINKKPIDTVIQVELTNRCNRSCSNCVRLCGHYPEDKIFYADLNDVAAYLEAFKDFRGWVSFIGGEPTLHPQFENLCLLMREYRQPNEAGLFTNTLTPQFAEHFELCRRTFGMLNMNNHKANITHTPVLVASQEAVLDEKERYAYFDNCWIQNTWSATITPKGAYFCEVAAMLAWLYDGPDGWDPRDPDWWKKQVPEYKEQIDWACNKCGAALPLKPRSSKETIDDISSGQLAQLIKAGSPKAIAGKYHIYSEGFIFGQNRARDWYRNEGRECQKHI